MLRRGREVGVEVSGGATDYQLGDLRAHIPVDVFFCLLAVARATRLLVIGCVGSIMTLGGGRRRQSVKQNAASVRLAGDALVSEVSPCLP